MAAIDVICDWCGEILGQHTSERLSACNECLKKDNTAYWSDGGQIYFVEGKGWGIAPNLTMVCIGDKADILKALKENKSMGNADIDKILRTELKNRGKEKLSSRMRLKRTTMSNKRHWGLK